MSRIEHERVGPLPVWGWAAVISVVVWALYIVTLAPTTGFWDTSEYIATAYILGLPHPPGNPLFVILGRVWIVLTAWTGLSVAVRINLMGATLSALSCFFWFLAMARLASRMWEDRRVVLVASASGVWIAATAFTVWSQSNLNEKVYPVSLFTVALVTYLAMRWYDEAASWRGDRLLLLIALIIGVGASNHTMSLLPLPALGLFILARRWRTVFKWHLVAGTVALYLLGFSIQLLFVPIRSAQNPIIDEADPQCASIVDAITPATIEDRFGDSKLAVECEALALSLIRDQYGKPPLSERQATFRAQLANYWQYFDWQWARTLEAGPRAGFTILFLFLALLGIWQHWKGDRVGFVYLGTMLATLTFGLIYYLNFRYGYSIYLDEVPDLNLHEVRERDYFYIIGFSVWGLYAGLGLTALWKQIATAVSNSTRPPDAAYLRASPVMALALIPLVLNFGKADRRGEYAARDWAYNILQSVEPYGILFTNGDNDTFPLWYMQEVEGIRRDVTVIVHSYLGTRWYPKQLRGLTAPCPEGVDPLERPTVIVCQRPFDAENAVGPYENFPAVPPTRSVIGWSDTEIDSLPPAFGVPADTTFRVGEHVAATVVGGNYVRYPDVLVYHIVQQAMGDRPVYFAATAPPVYSAWFLQPHLIRQGLAFKLVDAPLQSGTDTVSLGQPYPEGPVPWVDRTRTRELLWDVFEVDYLLEWDEWPEPSTRQSIPIQYFLAYELLAAADETVGFMDGATRNRERADQMYRLSGAQVPQQ